MFIHRPRSLLTPRSVLIRTYHEWSGRGSNPQPPHCERGALPIELPPHVVWMISKVPANRPKRKSSRGAEGLHPDCSGRRGLCRRAGGDRLSPHDPEFHRSGSCHAGMVSDRAGSPVAARAAGRLRQRSGRRGRSVPARTGGVDADRGQPGVPGGGGRRLGPQDPRARLYPGRDDGTYHLWYTGYNDDRAQDHVPGPRHLARRPALDPRPGEPDLHRVVGRGRLRRPPGRPRSSCSPRGRATSPTSSPRPTACTGTTSGSLDIRTTDGTPISPGPYGTPTAWFEDGTWYLFYERGDQGVWLATSKDRRVWTNVQDDARPRDGARAVRPLRRRHEPGHQARRRLLRLLSRQRAASPGRTGPPASPARATWSTGRSTPATRSSATTARAPSSSSTPQGDRLYTMHPDVKVFVHRPPESR